MAISTNPKPTIYRNLYEKTAPGAGPVFLYKLRYIIGFGHLDQSEANDISYLVREYGPGAKKWQTCGNLDRIIIQR